MAGVIHYLQAERAAEEQNSPQSWLRHATKVWTFYARRTTAQQRGLIRVRSSCRLRMALGSTVPEKGRRLQQARNMAARQALPIARACMRRRDRERP
jgi:AraC-like DNA-binding protein